MKLLNDNKEASARNRQNFSENIFRYFGAMAIALSSFLFLTACGETASERVDKVGGVTARQVIENPSAYVGKTVTVSGDVEEIWGPRAFNMDSGVTVGELLVVGREPFPQVAATGNRAYVVSDIATVTGVVRMLVTADVEREIGWDLDPRIEAEFNAKPVLIAQTISFRAGAGNSAQPVAANSNNSNMMSNSNMTGNSNTAAGADITDVLLIVVPDPTPLVGRRVRLTNVKVQDVVGDRTFYVGANENQRVLVVFEEEATPNTPIDGKVDVNKGQTVAINGVIRQMPSVDEARRRFGKLMNEAELKALANQRIYIQTDDPKIIKR